MTAKVINIDIEAIEAVKTVQKLKTKSNQEMLSLIKHESKWLKPQLSCIKKQMNHSDS